VSNWRRLFEAPKRVSPSAEGDLRLCLKNLPPFEKGGRKLPAAVVFNLNENFRAQRWKFTFNLSACGNLNSAKPILSRATRDINSAEGG